MKTDAVILFDGVCNLCDRTVQFVLRHDREKKYRFASLQSKVGQSFTAQLKHPSLTTIFLIQNNQVYDRSTAALKIAHGLGMPWSFLYALIVIPRPIRDLIYNWVARNRYKWFGKLDTCPLPDPRWRDRFLE